MNYSISDNTVRKILQQEDSEDEIISETEGYEGQSKHDWDTLQEVDVDDVLDIPLQSEFTDGIGPIFSIQLEEDY